MTTKDINIKGENKMELNRLSVALISVILTAAGMLATFSYKTGVVGNELKNIKANQITIKQDLEKDIYKLDEKKAEKDIVSLIFTRINDINGKLDKLILKDKD